MNKDYPNDLIPIGKVIRPHGLEGLLRILSFAQSEKSFLDSVTIFLKPSSEKPREYSLVSLRPHKKNFLLKLQDVNSVEDAEKFKGAEILIRKDSLSKKNDDEYFWHELIGLRVYLETDKYIGTIKHILPTGGNDIYIVGEGEEEIFIPAIHDVVKKIDLPNKKMIISEIEGLLDLNEV